MFHLGLVSCHLIIEHCTPDIGSNGFSELGKDNLRDFSRLKYVTIIDGIRYQHFYQISTFYFVFVPPESLNIGDS